MAEQVTETPLREVFLDKVAAFELANPEEGRALAGQLMYWGSSVESGEQNLWGIMESQIRYRAEVHRSDGHDVSPEEFIDFLFAPNSEGEITADIIMGRLQVG